MKSPKRIIVAALAIAGMLALSGNAHALSFTFSDKDFIGGASWGTLEITASDADTLKLVYTASPSPPVPDGSRATGFAFTFVPSTTIPGSVENPADGDFAGDRDELDWYDSTKYDKDGNPSNLYPNPANGDEFTPPITKFDYFFDIGNDPNNEGVEDGEMDIFFLSFAGVPDLTTIDLATFVALTGVRLQSLPENPPYDDINEGSLFLAGRPEVVPEPGTMLLLGTGLVGVGLLRRRKNRS